MLSCHEALFSSLNRRDCLKLSMNLTSRKAQLLYVKVMRETLKISRNHESSQESLKLAITLTKLIGACATLGINIDGAANFDLSNVLWDQGEMTTSIRMLQKLKCQNDLQKQDIPVSRAEVLACLVNIHFHSSRTLVLIYNRVIM
jgi:ataxia telangiectasia mutated family protein